IVNVGDSRLYRLDRDTVTQVTSDHSLAELLISRHGYTPDEARDHPQANQLYRSIGNKAHLEVGTFRTMLGPGDSLLLCSDGLSGLVSDMQLFRIVQAAGSPQAACDELVQQARDAGGHD